MTTWTCKLTGLTLIAAILTGCGAQPTGFLSKLGGKKNTPPPTSAPLARGAVTLVAPKGYCVDSASLKPDFALMARCDVLGAEDGDISKPLALITVSVAPTAEGDALPTADEIATIKKLNKPSETLEESGRVIFRTSGGSTAAGLADTHWRGATLVNGHMIGVALFTKAGGPELKSEGATIISDLINKTKGTQ